MKMFKLNKIQIFSTIVFSLMLGLTVSASPKSDAVYKVAVKALSQKLQNDLSAQNIDLKLGQVSRYIISKNETGLKGSGEVNNLPISFDVKVNTLKDIPTNVQYDFTANPANASDSFEESAAADTLTKALLTKLKHDYKTTNLVIALDEVTPVKVEGKNVYQGSGEVRIGFDWQKIDFTIALDPKNNLTQNIKYTIEP